MEVVVAYILLIISLNKNLIIYFLLVRDDVIESGLAICVIVFLVGEYLFN